MYVLLLCLITNSFIQLHIEQEAACFNNYYHVTNSSKNSQVKDYYCKQSKHVFEELGPKEDRVSVLIWIDDKLDDRWKDSLCEAVQAINEAAPGLSLSITEDEKQAIIHVLAIDKKDSEPYTEVEGNILNMRLKEKNFVSIPCLLPITPLLGAAMHIPPHASACVYSMS